MRIHPDRPIVGVGAATRDGGRVAPVERAHEPLKGEWSLPGGALACASDPGAAAWARIDDLDGYGVVQTASR